MKYALAVATTLMALALNPAQAHATAYCTPEYPWPASVKEVCTGYGTSCYQSSSCSPVSGVPGTWNPGGYTPRDWP